MRIHRWITGSAQPPFVAAVWTLVLAGLAAAPSHAVTQLTTQLVANGLTRPLYLTAPPGDDRLFIVEQRVTGNLGRVRIVKNGALLAKPFVTVGPVATGGEQGLLGLAFAPDYATSGRFYLHYNDAAGTTRLARYTVSAFADTANPVGQVIFTLAQPFSNHNGGWIAFGTDGYLWMALGDGGDAGDPGDRAQNIDNQLGKILRFNVSGAGNVVAAPDNPFVGAPGHDNVWCYGLRNPWRCSFDRLTDDLIIADVGQENFEEIDWAPASSGPAKAYNWGWRCYEGNTFYDSSATIPCGSCIAPSCNLRFPAHDYDHGLGRCSVTGGYVYRGCKIPDLQGTYFFADYCGDQIYSGRFSGGLLTGVTTRTTELDPAGASTITSITSFGEDAQGEVYICEEGGEVWRIVPRVAGVAEADMPTLQVSTSLGTLGSTTPGNAITPGITPFADAGSRVVGVGFLRTAQIRACPSSDPNCLYTHTRLGTWDIDLDACVDPNFKTLTRVLRFTNRAAGNAPLAYVDVVAPWLNGDDDTARVYSPFPEPGPPRSPLLAVFDAASPDLYVTHVATADQGFIRFDVDDYTALTARVAADQPLTNQFAAGPGRVAMATRVDAGDVLPGGVVNITLTNGLQVDAPVDVEPEIESVPGLSLRALGPLPFQGSLRFALALPGESAVQLDVFDVRGRRVRRLNAGTLSAGRHEVMWDGCDDQGAALGSGMYLVRLETPAGERAVRVVRVQ